MTLILPILPNLTSLKLIYYYRVFSLCSHIDGRAMTQTTFSQNNVKVVVSDNTVRINSPSNLQLAFSSANDLALSVSDEVANMVCETCGKLKPIDTTL